MSTKKLMSRVLKGLTMFAMVFALFVPCVGINAQTTANEVVNDDRNGVIQVKVVYVDDNNNESDVQAGSGFLISENYVVTAHHVIFVTDDTITEKMINNENHPAYGKKIKDVRNKLKYYISVVRDDKLPASIETSSEELDYAILNLQKPLKNKKILPIRMTDVENTENCYALGFPGAMEYFSTIQTHTSKDVTIESGKVSNAKKQMIIGSSIADYVTHSATTTEGMSGGPLVDEEGNVIGVIKGAITENFDPSYYYAVEISQLVEVFDIRGIEYTPAGQQVNPEPEPTDSINPEPEPEPVVYTRLQRTIDTAKAMDLATYKDGEEKTAFTRALEEAEDALSSNDQAAVDAANDTLKDAIATLEAAPKPGPGFPLWAIIAIAAAVILAIVIIALVVSGKKKKTAEPVQPIAPVPPIQPASPVQPAPPVNQGYVAQPVQPSNPFDNYGGSAGTTVLGETAGETTVLGGGAGETTVLSSQNFGTLTRKKTGERITITRDKFRIGRERRNVDYCISDNTNVGRLHAEIVSTGARTYVVDKHSTNSTFVNDQRITPNQQFELHSGDKVTFADEEFTYNA